MSEPLPKSTRPTLHLFCPSDEPETARRTPALSPNMSLCEFYEAHHRRVLVARKAAERNLTQFAESLRLWAKFTGDPPLSQIDFVTCSEFVEELHKLPGRKPGTNMADNTVRKHANMIQMVLDMAGPKTRKRKNAAALLDDPPYIERPPEQEKAAEDSFTLEEIERILAHCHVATDPSTLRTKAADYFRALFIFDYNVGFRIDTLMRIEWSMIKDDGCWMTVPNEIIKKKRGNVFYLNKPARGALDLLCRSYKRIFPWPYSWPASQSAIQTQRRKILDAAGIPKDRRFGFHGFRKAFTTEAATINPMAASMAANHASAQTTQKSYVRRELMQRALDQMPQPKPEQGRLFD